MTGQKLDVKGKVLDQIRSGVKKDFFELLAATGLSRSDLAPVLEDLISQGFVSKSSDGFVTLYSRRGQP